MGIPQIPGDDPAYVVEIAPGGVTVSARALDSSDDFKFWKSLDSAKSNLLATAMELSWCPELSEDPEVVELEAAAAAATWSRLSALGHAQFIAEVFILLDRVWAAGIGPHHVGIFRMLLEILVERLAGLDLLETAERFASEGEGDTW